MNGGRGAIMSWNGRLCGDWCLWWSDSRPRLLLSCVWLWPLITVTTVTPFSFLLLGSFFLPFPFRPPLCLFIHSFIRSFVRSFVHTFIHSFIYSFIHLCIHSFIHLYIIHSFIHSHFLAFVLLLSPSSFVSWAGLEQFVSLWASDQKITGSIPDWTVTIFWAPLPSTGLLVSV
jgi:hypothetical protein